nr:7-ethoxycoumarin o-deethylase [Quercus suber]
MLKRFDLQGVRRHVQVSYKRMHEIFDDLIAKRLKHRETDKTTRHGDFLDVLLDLMQEDGSDFSIDTIKPLILDLFIAGSDTSGLTTEWAMAELLRLVKLYMPPDRAENYVILLGKTGKLSIAVASSTVKPCPQRRLKICDDNY